jgi:UDPglucose--hexose-1-phosphate uridylyltransferase
VVIAPLRSRRPGVPRPSADPEACSDSDTANCPFCEGHEDRTPPETFALGPPERPPDTPGWLVRVVPNKFPAFAPELTGPPRHVGLLESRPPRGNQEVVVSSPRHVSSLAELEPDEVGRVAAAWQARAGEAARQGFPYVQAIFNEGREAGASLSHSHSQLLWVEAEPPAVEAEHALDRAGGGCLVCRLLEEELANGERVVSREEGVVALATYAARQPYELLVAPDSCEEHPFESVFLAPALTLAARQLAHIHELEGAVPMNLWLHAGAHWHIELVPRITVPAGLELGAGLHVNPLAPETAAERLRAGS